MISEFQFLSCPTSGFALIKPSFIQPSTKAPHPVKPKNKFGYVLIFFCSSALLGFGITMSFIYFRANFKIKIKELNA